MPDQSKKLADWTIMMYIAADDVLANFAIGSLKELKRAASPEVVVAAQFDADGTQNIPLMIFDGSTDKDASLKIDRKDEIPRDTDMADPTVLTQFINWAHSRCPARHYALVLWGHGPELLFDDYPVPGSKKSKNFMTPSDLGNALARTDLVAVEHRRFDVIGIDACNMSMIELAYEIKGYADFLVASQDEVPDFSFPYDSLLQAFGSTDKQDQIIGMCKDLPRRYATAYEDYILTKETRLESLTLSSLALNNVDKIIGPLTSLTTQLLEAIHDPVKRQAIIDARANSKGFVAGLYTDLCDFCEQLRSQLCLAKVRDEAMEESCNNICDAIRRLDGQDACIIANQACQNKHCHGLSIYFPYLTDDEKKLLDAPLAPLVKGGIDVLDKGGIDVLDKTVLGVLNQSGSDALDKVRRQRIQDTEKYYDGLAFSEQTKWGEFIKHGWSQCLAEYAEMRAQLFTDEDASDILDERYSAQQCALNLLSLYRKPGKVVPLSSPPVAGSKQKHHLLGPTATHSLQAEVAAQSQDKVHIFVTVDGNSA